MRLRVVFSEESRPVLLGSSVSQTESRHFVCLDNLGLVGLEDTSESWLSC